MNAAINATAEVVSFGRAAAEAPSGRESPPTRRSHEP